MNRRPLSVACVALAALVAAALVLPVGQPTPLAVPALEPATVAVAQTRGGKTLDLTFDDIKFEMNKEEPFKRSLIPAKIEDMDGARIKIRGYILPSFQQSGIKQFVLVRDNMECCFGPGAALYDCILVEMVGSASAEFTTRPVTVEGVFSIREFKGPDDKHLAIYHLDGERVSR